MTSAPSIRTAEFSSLQAQLHKQGEFRKAATQELGDMGKDVEQFSSEMRKDVTHELEDLWSLGISLTQAVASLRDGQRMLQEEYQALRDTLAQACLIDCDELDTQTRALHLGHRGRHLFQNTIILKSVASYAGMQPTHQLCNAFGVALTEAKRNVLVAHARPSTNEGGSAFRLKKRLVELGLVQDPRILARGVSAATVGRQTVPVLGTQRTPPDIGISASSRSSFWSAGALERLRAARKPASVGDQGGGDGMENADVGTDSSASLGRGRKSWRNRKSVKLQETDDLGSQLAILEKPRVTGVWPELLLLEARVAFVIGSHAGMASSCRLAEVGRAHRTWLREAVPILATNILPEVFIFGGHPGSMHERPEASCEQFDANSGGWESFPEMAQARTYCTVVTTSESMFILGGFDGRRHLASSERLDVATRRWSSLPSMIASRAKCAAAAFAGNIYAVDGLCGQPLERPRCERYDMSANVWMALPLVPAISDVRGAAVAKRRLYLGGTSKHKVRMEHYDPVSGRRGEAMPLTRIGFQVSEIVGAASVQDRIYLAGNHIEDLCIFNAVSGEWEPHLVCSQLPRRLRTMQIECLGSGSGQICFFGHATEHGGLTANHAEVIALRFEPCAEDNDNWAVLPSMGRWRQGSATALRRP